MGVLATLALVLPLSLDTFAVAAALGIAQLPANRRLRISLLFTAFEAGMPMVGLLVGAAAGAALGTGADYLAIAGLIGLGGYMLFSRDNDDKRTDLLTKTQGPAMLSLGLAISLDELAIGFSLGLLRVPLLPAIVLIATQAFIATQLGLRLGARVGERFRENAERVAGVALIVLGLGLLAAKIARVAI
jgi:putative Mn2+ efflux pump MntP